MSVSMVLDDSSESIDSEDSEHLKVGGESTSLYCWNGKTSGHNTQACDILYHSLLPPPPPSRYSSPQEKLRVLKRYGFELKESYDELLRAFSQLEVAAKEKIAALESRLLAALTAAKVGGIWWSPFCVKMNVTNPNFTSFPPPFPSLPFSLPFPAPPLSLALLSHPLFNLYNGAVMSLQEYQRQAQVWEGQLSVMRERVNELERENGRMREERGELERQRDMLQVEDGRCEAVEQDLGHVLQLIHDGINSGTLRVSILQ